MFRAFGLSWAGVAIGVCCVFAPAGFLVARSYVSTRNTRVLVGPAAERYQVTCPHCGWGGAVSSLTRGRDAQGLLELNCPQCGGALTHQATADADT